MEAMHGRTIAYEIIMDKLEVVGVPNPSDPLRGRSNPPFEKVRLKGSPLKGELSAEG